MKIRSKLGLVLTVGVAGLVAGSIAWAAVPDGAGVIHACYNDANGRVRITDTQNPKLSACLAKTETALDWNQQGPAGPAGDTGPRGASGLAGDTGPQGPAGSAGQAGDRGAQGERGPAGAQGDTGAQGEQGAAGPVGPQGPAGAQGPQGPAGAPGGDPAADAVLSRFGQNTNGASSATGTPCTLGEIRLTASTNRTAGGVPASGQLLPIGPWSSLFFLLGTTYGGDGHTNFALPDLRGLAPNHMTYSICIQGTFPEQD
jgi:hypothetical protein